MTKGTCISFVRPAVSCRMMHSYIVMGGPDGWHATSLKCGTWNSAFAAVDRCRLKLVCAKRLSQQAIV